MHGRWRCSPDSSILRPRRLSNRSTSSSAPSFRAVSMRAGYRRCAVPEPQFPAVRHRRTSGAPPPAASISSASATSSTRVSGIGIYSRTSPAIYRDFTHPGGAEIEQDLKLRVVPITATFRFLPLGHRDAIVPYIGGGVGIYRWRYSEVGEFLDIDGQHLQRLRDYRRERYDGRPGRPGRRALPGGIQGIGVRRRDPVPGRERRSSRGAQEFRRHRRSISAGSIISSRSTSGSERWHSWSVGTALQVDLRIRQCHGFAVAPNVQCQRLHGRCAAAVRRYSARPAPEQTRS